MSDLREYNPLNGIEVKEAILQSISRKLDQHPDLVLHIAFKRLTFRWGLELDVYPWQSSVPRVETGGDLGDTECADLPESVFFDDEVRVGTEISPSAVRLGLDEDRAVEAAPEHLPGTPVRKQELGGLQKFLRRK